MAVEAFDSGSGGGGSSIISVKGDPGLIITRENTNEVMMKLYFLDKLSIELNSNVNTMTDQCGKTEAHKQGSNNWTMTVRGRVPASQLDTLKDIGVQETIWYADSYVHDMPFVVQDMTIDQLSDENSLEWVTEYGDTKEEMAFGFQMQLKKPTSNTQN